MLSFVWHEDAAASLAERGCSGELAPTADFFLFDAGVLLAFVVFRARKEKVGRRFRRIGEGEDRVGAGGDEGGVEEGSARSGT